MFRLIEPSSGQIQNIVLVYSVSAHYGIPYKNMGPHNMHSLNVEILCFVFGLMMVQ